MQVKLTLNLSAADGYTVCLHKPGHFVAYDKFCDEVLVLSKFLYPSAKKMSRYVSSRQV